MKPDGTNTFISQHEETNLIPHQSKKGVADWSGIISPYQQPSGAKAWWQITNTLVPYTLLWFLMYHAANLSWWLTLPLAALAGAFLVRIFIIFHDCGHGSFLKSPTANHLLGTITGILTFTPYFHWRWEHAIHHSSSGDLDRRGTGDVWTMTVQEYLESSRWRRFAYRVARNPIVLFVIAPWILFLGINRLPNPKAPTRERYSVHLTNLAVGTIAIGLIWIFGIASYLIIQFTLFMVAGSSGIWLFYVQHQFDGGYWERADKWDYAKAALLGSSFYKLPRLLQWFSGNIGYHHIHHLSPGIPNYHLEKCHKSEPIFNSVKPVTLFASFKSITFHLWDERHKKFVAFRHLKSPRKCGQNPKQTPSDTQTASQRTRTNTLNHPFTPLPIPPYPEPEAHGQVQESSEK